MRFPENMSFGSDVTIALHSALCRACLAFPLLLLSLPWSLLPSASACAIILPSGGCDPRAKPPSRQLSGPLDRSRTQQCFAAHHGSSVKVNTLQRLYAPPLIPRRRLGLGRRWNGFAAMRGMLRRTNLSGTGKRAHASGQCILFLQTDLFPNSRN